MAKQVFLGGACGRTTWRKDIAIPILERHSITYFDPQLDVGAWTPANEAEEMDAKDSCLVQVFVVSRETRGVAAVAEASYLIGAQKPVAICLQDMNPGTVIEGVTIDQYECDDLNRGRIFLRTMAKRHSVPVFETVEETIEYAVELVKKTGKQKSINEIKAILEKVEFKDLEFLVSESTDGFYIHLKCDEPCAYTHKTMTHDGRKWHVEKTATTSEVVQTAFKAVATWQEHEGREFFKYKGMRVFGPHFKVEELRRLCEERKASNSPRTPTPRQ